MNIGFVNIDDENRGDFYSVLPEFFAGLKGVAIGACDDDDMILGALFLSCDGSEYDIDWLFVEPLMRRRGVGRALLTEVKRMVYAIGICPIIARFDATDESGLYEFFISVRSPELMVDVTYSHNRYVAEAVDFIRSPLMKQNLRTGYITDWIFDMDEDTINSIMDIVMEYYVIKGDDFGDSYENRLCLFVHSKSMILALMLVEHLAGGDLNLSYLYARDPKALAALLKSSLVELKKGFKSKKIYFDTINEASERLAKKILPQARVSAIYEAEM